MRVRDWMTPEPETVERSAPLRDAVAIMHELGVREVPVVEDESVVGILTDRDVRMILGMSPSDSATLSLKRKEMSRPVTQFMTQGLVSVGEGLPLAEAARILAELRVGSLPVIDENDRLSGILSVTDVLKAAVVAMGGERDL